MSRKRPAPKVRRRPAGIEPRRTARDPRPKYAPERRGPPGGLGQTYRVDPGGLIQQAAERSPQVEKDSEQRPRGLWERILARSRSVLTPGRQIGIPEARKAA